MNPITYKLDHAHRLLRGKRQGDIQMLLAYCVRELRCLGVDVDVPEQVQGEYNCVKIAEHMRARGAPDTAVERVLQAELTRPILDAASHAVGAQLKITKGRPGPSHEPTLKGDIMSQIPMPAQQAPRPYAPQAAIGPSPEERIKQAQEALAQAEQAKAQEDAQKALEARLNHEQALCSATAALLGAIRTFGHTPGQATSRVFAEFRKELTPLAESYGYKLVLVGDKTQATLTKL